MIFKVYHRIEPTFRVDASHVHNFFKPEVIRDKFYRHVANVQCDELGQVFELTNHVDQNWTLNMHVDSIGTEPKRSTSVGDVVVDNAGLIYICAPTGWIQVK